MTTKVAKTYAEIRQLGYNDGVENERAFVVRELLALAIEKKEAGLEDQAKLLATVATKLQNGFHIVVREPQEGKATK